MTAWNVEEMRAAVRNGPSVHPGAVAVEDELGRVISLANFSLEVCDPREAEAQPSMTGIRREGARMNGLWGAHST